MQIDRGSWPSRPGMLRVRMASGEDLAALPVQDLVDVRHLKRHLRGATGLPRFRQRLLHHDTALSDDVSLDSPLELQLVLLPFAGATMEQKLELTMAAEAGDLSELEALLQRPQDPNLADGCGTTPLTRAAEAGHVEAVHLLMEAGADKDAVDSDGCTALHEASRRGWVDVMRVLLEAGADKQAKMPRGSTALHCAAASGAVEAVALLLEARADVAAANLGGSLFRCRNTCRVL